MPIEIALQRVVLLPAGRRGRRPLQIAPFLCSFANSRYSSSFALIPAACAALTGRTTFPGTPMTRLPAGMTISSGTSAPAATRPAPMTAPFKIVACIPIKQSSPTVQPCTTALWPMDTFLPPYRHIQPGAGVQHGVVLHVAVLADGDAPGIGRAAPRRTRRCCPWPGHTARQRGVVRHKGRTVPAGAPAITVIKAITFLPFDIPTGRRALPLNH